MTFQCSSNTTYQHQRYSTGWQVVSRNTTQDWSSYLDGSQSPWLALPHLPNLLQGNPKAQACTSSLSTRKHFFEDLTPPRTLYLPIYQFPRVSSLCTRYFLSVCRTSLTVFCCVGLLATSSQLLYIWKCLHFTFIFERHFCRIWNSRLTEFFCFLSFSLSFSTSKIHVHRLVTFIVLMRS